MFVWIEDILVDPNEAANIPFIVLVVVGIKGTLTSEGTAVSNMLEVNLT